MDGARDAATRRTIIAGTAILALSLTLAACSLFPLTSEDPTPKASESPDDGLDPEQDATEDPLVSDGDSAVEPSDGGTSTSTSPETTPWEYRTLDYFRESPSDRFVVDITNIAAGHPYIGTNTPTSVAAQPHSGAHLTYDVASWPRGGNAPENYPAVYAVADAKVVDVSTWWGMGPDDPYCRNLDRYDNGAYDRCDNHPDQRCGDIRHLTCPDGVVAPTSCTSSVSCTASYVHYKYDIRLQIARQNGEEVTFSYSIEPFTTPRDPVTGTLLPRFYEPFIKVSKGQTVHKGDILAYHYLNPGDPNATGAHIHYQINRVVVPGEPTFSSPSIFTQDIVNALKPTWTGPGFNAAGISLCMGVFLGRQEIPFSSLDPENDGADCM